MTNPARWLPLVALLGGVTYAGANYDKLEAAVTNKVKTLLTGFELGNIRDALLSHVATGGQVPLGPGDLANFLDDNFQARTDGRLVSLDLWETPYGIETEDLADDRFLLSSNGPDAVPDCCTNLQNLVRSVEAMAAGTSEDAPRVTPSCNDVCVSVRLIYRGQMGDTFRPIR
jgi:hypothetical protein